MRTLAVMNQKGGVGKTTTTVSLAAALVERGHRVCCIDLDPQAHLSINFGLEPADATPNVYDMLVDRASLLEAVHTSDAGVAVVPSTVDLAAAEVELVSVLGREALLKKRLDSATHDFDIILLDCPPSLGLLTVNALGAATEVLIPMQAHFLALQGMAKLLETIQLVRQRLNPRLLVTGIVLTMYDPQTKLTGEIVGELQGFLDQQRDANQPWSDAVLFETRVRRNIKLAESPSFGQTILTYESQSNGATDYRALAEELERTNPHEIEAELERELRPQVTVNPDLDPARLAATRVGRATEDREESPADEPTESVADQPSSPS